MQPIRLAARAALAAAAMAAVLAVAAGPASAATLPPDWPAQVPLPPGSIQGATGRAPQWGVLLLVSGSAPDAHRAAVAFYRDRGFAASSDSVLRRGSYQVTVVVENRDHRPDETFLAIGVTRTGAGATTLRPSVLPGRPSIGLSEARRAGLQVAFVAPAGARTARVRLVRGGRVVASRTARVRSGRNVVVLASPALRRRLRPGRYAIRVALRGAGGPFGPTEAASIRVTAG